MFDSVEVLKHPMEENFQSFECCLERHAEDVEMIELWSVRWRLQFYELDVHIQEIVIALLMLKKYHVEQWDAADLCEGSVQPSDSVQ